MTEITTHFAQFQRPAPIETASTSSSSDCGSPSVSEEEMKPEEDRINANWWKKEDSLKMAADEAVHFRGWSVPIELDFSTASSEDADFPVEDVVETNCNHHQHPLTPSAARESPMHVPTPLMSRHESFLEPGPSCIALRNAVLALYRLDDFNADFLADGYFSHVYKVTHKTTGDVMVLKMVKPEISCKSSVLREVQLMNRLRHPNVIRFKGVCVDNGKLHALTEYCNAGSLDSLILSHNRSLEWRILISLALDIARGMEYVHSLGYIHRDLTAVNILLKGTGDVLRALVADFGLACKIPKPGGPLPDAEGNPYWRAPECLKEEWYNEKSDVFSLGIISCQMISRLDADPDVGLPRTSQFGLDYIRFAELCSDDTPVDFLKIAFSCCFMDPKARPSCSEVARALLSAWRNALPLGAGLAPETAAYRRSSIIREKRRGRKYSGSSSDINLTRSLSDAGFKSLPYSLNESRGARTRQERRTDPEAATSTSPIASSKDSEVLKEREVEVLAEEMAAADPFYMPEEYPYQNPFVRNDKLRSVRKSFGKPGVDAPDSVFPPFTPEALRFHDPPPEESTPKTALFQSTHDESPCSICTASPTKDPKDFPLRRCLSLPGSPVPERAICPAFMAKMDDISGNNSAGPDANPHQPLDSLAKEFFACDTSFQASKNSTKRRNTVMPLLTDLPEDEDEEITVNGSVPPDEIKVIENTSSSLVVSVDPSRRYILQEEMRKGVLIIQQKPSFITVNEEDIVDEYKQTPPPYCSDLRTKGKCTIL